MTKEEKEKLITNELEKNKNKPNYIYKPPSSTLSPPNCY
jgi:hypothetical protein